MTVLIDTHRAQLHRVANLLDGNARREIDGDASKAHEITECVSLMTSVGAKLTGTGAGEGWSEAERAMTDLILFMPWRAGSGAKRLLRTSAAINRVLAQQ